MAYEVDGEIFVSEKDEAAPEEFFLSDGTPALVPTEPYEALGVGDPELVWDGNFVVLVLHGAGTRKARGASVRRCPSRTPRRS